MTIRLYGFRNGGIPFAIIPAEGADVEGSLRIRIRHANLYWKLSDFSFCFAVDLESPESSNVFSSQTY